MYFGCKKKPAGAHPDTTNLDNTDSVYVIQRISVSDIDNVCICNMDILYATMEILDIWIYGTR